MCSAAYFDYNIDSIGTDLNYFHLFEVIFKIIFVLLRKSLPDLLKAPEFLGQWDPPICYNIGIHETM